MYCGGRIIGEVRVKRVRHSSGKRFFTANYEEQIESLTKRLEEAEQLLNLMQSLKIQVETPEAQAKGLTRQVDRLTARTGSAGHGLEVTGWLFAVHGLGCLH
ncbi:hypothetical protein Bca52824_014869 [Brassica carinata]|uniref:Uncharacterized protein n=1 Tax=Brassica carinata TaxID=52824 RepID=A0A8X7W264_BRACI|nr:hypothetical protein Bca52824_014869 [Brassica carinata]